LVLIHRLSGWRVSRCAAEFDAWKIHRNIEGDIDIVCEEIKRDMGDNLDDLAIVVPLGAQGPHIRIRDLAPGLDKL
jgi:hypothetical protein